VQPVLHIPVAGLADDRRIGGAHDDEEGLGVDPAVAEVLVAVPARPGRILRVVAVDEVDAAGIRVEAGQLGGRTVVDDE